MRAHKSLQPHHSTRFCDFVTLARPPLYSFLKVNNRYFRLWNELPKELCQPVDDESLSLTVTVIYLIFLSPVHHHHHHHYHFHYASLHLSSTPDLKLTFSVNPFHHSLSHLFGRISRIFTTIPDLIAHRFLFCFFLFDTYDRLSWFNLILNCTLNSWLSFPFYLSFPLSYMGGFWRRFIRNFVRVCQEYGIFWCCHGNERSRDDRYDQATPMIAISRQINWSCLGMNADPAMATSDPARIAVIRPRPWSRSWAI